MRGYILSCMKLRKGESRGRNEDVFVFLLMYLCGWMWNVITMWVWILCFFEYVCGRFNCHMKAR